MPRDRISSSAVVRDEPVSDIAVSVAEIIKVWPIAGLKKLSVRPCARARGGATPTADTPGRTADTRRWRLVGRTSVHMIA